MHRMGKKGKWSTNEPHELLLAEATFRLSTPFGLGRLVCDVDLFQAGSMGCRSNRVRSILSRMVQTNATFSRILMSDRPSCRHRRRDRALSMSN
jgi:hypothetical protein